tara:strand:+ start:1351 stop:3081 length:1731 start_codon:yes stop_codon:yes gene_type:complete
MAKKGKLELAWVGKDDRPRLEPRILIEDPEKSYHAKQRRSDGDIFDNILIKGDNLLALKALESKYSEAVKCIYIDPPFNTGQAFENYDDGVEHSLWLSLLRERLELLKRLLAKNGTIFIHIDDNELGYLLVLADEIFGRSNRRYVISFKQGSATGHKSINPGCVNTTNFILIYSKSQADWEPNRVFTARDVDRRYNQCIENYDDDFAGWQIVPLFKTFSEDIGVSDKVARKMVKDKPSLLDEWVIKNADRVVQLANPDYNSVGAETRNFIDMSLGQPDVVFKQVREGYPDIYLRNGKRILFYSSKLKKIDGRFVSGEPLTTLWDDLLSNNIHKEGGVKFPKGKKPEALIKRCIEMSTNEGDIVLDSFAGSGSTGATAHKMMRKWIMVEIGEHCETHVVPRLQKVVDGTDIDGVTKAVNWSGGGGFRYFTLAPSLIETDRFGMSIISKDYNAAMLAEAMCKHMGFTYAPSETDYWNHGFSTETDFIYVTTQSLTHDTLRKISADVGKGRTLLVCCKAYSGGENLDNLTIHKIPSIVLDKCEWGRDDYSLNVANLPMAEEEDPDADLPLFADGGSDDE